MKKLIMASTLITAMFGASAFADSLKPYIMAHTASTQADQVKQVLQDNGFQIAGSYNPYAGANVIVATNDTLKSGAANSKFGGYGAMIRVSVTQVDGQPQISYVNPEYMKHAYRMKTDMSGVKTSLETALGNGGQFGSADGMSAKQLQKYHYMFAMPYFDDHIELASYANHQEALSKVDAGLSSGAGVKKVYRIDIPGKNESVFGVAITAGEGADQTMMKAIDKGKQRHTAHLPYEVLVSDGKAYILHGKFRIAQSFPDLSMGSFMGISGAPDAIENTIGAAIK